MHSGVWFVDLIGKDYIASMDNSGNVAKDRQQNVDSQMIGATLL